ncbi:MAG TPA: T9SS type A sorting domain-containing protein, partial [Chitinophagales bacterium]|nr:T9SS type A sorting domain-containing protein [Chitinophagales bacterium]
NANTHLPYVKQKSNVALVMYRPEKGLALFGYKDAKLSVALHWQDEKFDEIRESGNWLLGREGEGYVAVRRHSTGYINGVRADDNPDGQTWVFMVGNSDMYGSFDNFEQKILEAQYQEKWYFDLPTFSWVYYAKIVVDGKTIEYAWNGDVLSGPTRTTGIRNSTSDTKKLTVYPNPAQDNITIDFSSMIFKSANLKVENILGQEVYSENMERVLARDKMLNTSNWPEGMYLISVECEQQFYTQKVLIKR